MNNVNIYFRNVRFIWRVCGSHVKKCKIVVLSLVKRRELNTADNIVVESCIIKLQMRNKPAHLLLQESEYNRCTTRTLQEVSPGKK